MKLRITFLASIAIALSLALVGVLRDATPTRANMPLPVQPFWAKSVGGISGTQLGTQIATNITGTQVKQGERVTLPWIYSGSGFSVDQADPLGTNVGSVYSVIDVNCDGSPDTMNTNCSNPDPAASPLAWNKTTTAVTGTADEYLLKIMPPFTWLLRHTAIINYVCVGGGSVSSPSVLNTVYAEIPFAPTDFSNKKAFVAQTQLGGAPDTPPSKICLDSPQNSTSATTVYNNPPTKGDSNSDGKDDGSGLYARWTIFQSKGSSSLNIYSDMRKSYAGAPSIPSDTGYVERIVQLECFWIDGNGCGAACDVDSNHGYISPDESWNDPDLVALGGRDAVDADHDCLMNAAHVQPGWPAIDAVDTPTGVSCDSNPNWKVYSENPDDVDHDTAADQDCDGLLDGIEWFWGGSALVTAADGDNDGAPDFVEMFQFTNPKVADTDGDSYADKPAGTYGDNTDVTVDNCPTVANPTQVNTDGHRRDNGPNIPNANASNPNQDKLGDACDPDNDNDGATDVYEDLSRASGGGQTDKTKMDTDGDTVNDAAEARIYLADPGAADPLNAAIKPAWNNNEQIYYRGCQINVNDTDYPAFIDQDAAHNHIEMDVDGDGIDCPVDNDSDTALPAKKPEVLDKYEAWGYNTLVSNPDTDGDGCADWVEIHDLNGDRSANSGDTGLMNKRAAGKIAADPVSDKIFDVNKDGSISSGDTGQMNKNNCLFKSGIGGCPTCASEN